MQYYIMVETNDAPTTDAVGLSATVGYVITDQLKRIPGIINVSISQFVTIEPEGLPAPPAAEETPPTTTTP